MKLVMLGLAAAIAGGAALSTTPASAGSYFEFGVGPSRHYYGPPPPPPVYYAPRRAYYYEAAPAYRAPPREVCRVRTVREWGPYGPYDKRVETCRRNGGW